MVATYRPKHFSLVELVDPDTYHARGERSWELLQAPALITLDQIREKFGRITVNNWAQPNGRYKDSGLRQMNSPIGAKLSQHKFGGAFDCKPQDVTVKAMYDWIIANPNEFPLLTTLEHIDDTPSWLHFDVRNHGFGGIWIVRP